jgi:exosortase
MTTAALRLRAKEIPLARWAPWGLTAAAFLLLFAEPLRTLARDWWTDPEAGHGLLLFPVALWLAWRRGWEGDARPQPALGLAVLIAAVLLRYLSGLAAELFTMRVSLLLAASGLLVFARGWRQLRAWWLPVTLIALSVPLPSVVLGSLALPLQFKASQLGAWLLQTRHVPVRLAGNVIYLPGRSLFVTEACSGLRSLTALLSLGVLTGGLWLATAGTRIALVAAAIPVAMVLNGVRVFLTGFLVYFVDPRLGDGFLHLTEGWAIFLVAFAILGGLTWGLRWLEQALARRAVR